MIYLSDFHKWGLFGFRASVVNVLRLENTIFQCVSIQNVQKQQNVTAWHNHKSDHNSGIRQKLACPRIVLQSLSPSGVVELIFSGTRLIFLKLIYLFPHYHSFVFIVSNMCRAVGDVWTLSWKCNGLIEDVGYLSGLL